MIYIACGSVMIAVGLIWLISPARKPNRLYGYLSYLAQSSKESFKFAQRRASLYLLLFGAIQAGLGVIIHLLGWDRFFLLWLLTFYLFIIWPVAWTEKSLKKFLLEKKQLPANYVDPDKRPRKSRVKGFKDR